MSLQLVPPVPASSSGRNAYGNGASAVVTARNRVIVGITTGDLRIYSKQDLVLERVVRAIPSLARRRASPVTALSHIPHTELIAALSDGRCALHDLQTRKSVHEFDSSSARFVCGGSTTSKKPRAVVGSAYKLRIFREEDKTVSVIDSPGKQHIRAMCLIDSSAVVVAVGNGLPRLWVLNLDTELLKPFAALPMAPFAGGHKFMMCATSTALFVGANTGGVLLSREPLRVLSMYTETGFTSAVTVISEPTNIPLFAVNNGISIMVLNPLTGTPLFSLKSSARLLASQNEESPALAAAGSLLELHCLLNLNQIVSLGRHEASSLGFSMAPESGDGELRELQREEAALLFSEGNVSESMRMFTSLEEHSNDQITVKKVLSLVDSYLQKPESQLDSENSSREGDHSSTFSVRTVSKQHPLDPIVSFLAFERRKLRLQGNDDNKELASRVDTTLFFCYLRMKSRLITPLLRSSNYCDAEAVKTALLEHGKWRELVYFFKSRGNHEEALALLTEHKEPAESIISYLEQVTNLDTIFEFAKPVFLQHPQLARRLFFEMYGVDMAKVYEFLKGIDSNIANEFALFRVQVAKDKTPELHDATAEILANSPSRLDEAEEFIKTSEYLRPEIVLRNAGLPAECKALLNERLGEYKTAIVIYMSIGDLKAATKCAERYSLTSYLFEQLSPENIPEFLNMVRPDSDLSIMSVLDRIKDLKLESVKSFITNFTIYTESERRSALADESAGRAALAEYTIDLNDQKTKKWTVDVHDTCSICHRRLGKAVSAAGEGVVHYSCYTNQKRTNNYL